MKKIATLLLLITTYLSSRAQQWSWVTALSTSSVSIPAPGVLATGKNAVMWGALIQKNMLFGSEVYGKYVVSEHDTAGTAGASMTIDGRAMLIDARCDAAGNYYVLGKVFDSAFFSGGFQAVRTNNSDPKYFLCRLDKGTLAVNWFKYLGIDDNSSAQSFTVTGDGVYIFVDTAFTTTVLYRYDLASGNDHVVLTQNNTGRVTSIQVDQAGNIYVAGGGVSIFDADFNGHHVTIPMSNPYPAYIVRYKTGGIYDWSTIMTDVTLTERQLSLSSNNVIYYSGHINDSFTIDGFSVRHPTWVYDFLVSRMDSTGNVQWLRQLPDTMGGDAHVHSPYHAAALDDGSLSISASGRYYVRWGGNVVTDNGTDESATVVNYASNGAVNWALPVIGDYSVPGYIGTDGENIWFTGSGYDSTALHFGPVAIPTTYYNYKTFLSKIRPGTPPPAAVSNTVQPLSAGIFPNPASDRIYIQYNTAKPAMITVSNVAGKIMSRKAASGQVSESVNIASWPAGIYFAEITSDTERFVQKFVVQ